MTHRPYTIGGNQTSFPAPASSAAPSLACDTTEHTGELDGTVAGMRRFLCELVEMTGQGGRLQPVLELQFGAVVTSSVVVAEPEGGSLSITVLLPRPKRAAYLPLSSAQAARLSAAADQWACLWHADRGHYVVVRNLSVKDFQTERSVMDAIADTSEHAALWLAWMAR